MIRLGRISVFVLSISLFAAGASAATYTVTKIADTNDGLCNSDCSLREAIAAANATADGDTIQFEFPLFNTPQTIVLSGTEIGIANNGSLTIDGPGADRLTLDGNNASRIISTTTGVVATIRGIRFTRGNGVGAVNTNSGGAILNNAGSLTLENSIVTNNTTSGSAGGIRNSGTGSVMTIDRCIISNNTSTGSSAGGVQNFSTSTITVTNTTFTGNTSGGGSVGGGAMQLNGTARITNSTFFGNNSATTGGGGAINSNGPLLLLTNVTISGNSATANGGGLARGTTNVNGFIRNSIIAGNNGGAASPDVTNSAGGLASQGNNIIGNVGTSTGWVGSDQQNVNPLLSPLGSHGGMGMTHALLGGSTARDAGQNCVTDLSCGTNNPPAAITVDQRGALRPTNATVDIGSYEFAPGNLMDLPSATLDVPYSLTIAPNAAGFAYLQTVGTLPNGINFVSNGSSAALTGTPTETGDHIFFISTTSNSVPSQTITHGYILLSNSAEAFVNVGGRVLGDFGRGVPYALVTLTDNATSVTRTMRSNSFGIYNFKNVPNGRSYMFGAKAKGYNYQSFGTFITDNVSNIDLTPMP